MERLESGRCTRVCPLCEAGRLLPHGLLARCDWCCRVMQEAVLTTLEQIAALPDAAGAHACECGHPEMRRLPDGVFHCPACGSEVTPVQTAFEHKELARND